MEPTFDPTDDDLLAALLAGERHEHEAGVRQRLHAQPALRERLARMRQLAAELDAVGAGDREFLQAALQQPSPAEAGMPGMVLRTLRRPRPFRWPLIVAGVAAAVALALLLWSLQPRPATSDSILGTLAVGEVSPAGGPSDYRLFRWNMPLPPDCRYRVRFHQSGVRQALLELEPTEPQWTPTPDQINKLPRTMDWEIEVVDLGGTVKSSRGPFRIYYESR